MSINSAKKQKKTEALTLRLDPRMKFQIELLSRIWHQSITGVIETAIERAAGSVKYSADSEESIRLLAEVAWSPDDAERLIRMVIKAPHLMSFEESCIWAVIEAAEEDCFFRYWFTKRGQLVNVRPRVKVIKMAWDLLLAKAAEIKKYGSAEPISYYELTEFIGTDPERVRESERMKPWDDAYESENWLSKWSSLERDDLIGELGADRGTDG